MKRLIAIKLGLGPEGADELTLYDPNTNDEYADTGKVIPRNSLVIVKRAPITKFKPLQSTAPVAAATAPVATAPAAAAAAGPATQPAGATSGAAAANGAAPAAAAAPDEFGGDYYSEQPQRAVVGEDEDKALQNLLRGTADKWGREVRQGAMRGRGRGRGGRGMAPLDYRCPRCVALCAEWPAGAGAAGQLWSKKACAEMFLGAGAAAGSWQTQSAGQLPGTMLHRLRKLPAPPGSQPTRLLRFAPSAPQVRGGGAALGAGLPHPG